VANKGKHTNKNNKVRSRLWTQY